MLHEIIYYLLLAIVSATCLIVFAKLILIRIIQRSEDYYYEDFSTKDTTDGPGRGDLI